jgi:hypothetical protein
MQESISWDSFSPNDEPLPNPIQHLNLKISLNSGMKENTRNDDGAISEIGFCDWKRRELRDEERHDGRLQYRYSKGVG